MAVSDGRDHQVRQRKAIAACRKLSAERCCFPSVFPLDLDPAKVFQAGCGPVGLLAPSESVKHLGQYWPNHDDTVLFDELLDRPILA